MQKTITSLNKTDSLNPNLKLKNNNTDGPSDYAIRKILQFASNYRAEKVGENQYIEMILN